MAWVANGYTGDVGIIDLTRGKPVDVNLQIPGYTRVRLGTWLSDIVALPDGSRVFAADPVERTLVGMDTVTLEETGAFSLPGSPLKIVLAEGAEPLLWVLTTDPPGLIPVDPETGPEDGLHLDGIPSDAAFDATGVRLVVGYQDLHHVSVVDLASRETVARIGLLDACADGLDNDGDGLADAADPHCSDLRDDDEASPAEAGADQGACGNGLDDDGDGLADDADPGCTSVMDDSESEDAPGEGGAAQPLDAWVLTCENGLDDDDDGLADGDDPDCAADPMGPEAAWFACADGLDNDGDGLTDWPEDPHCYRAADASEAGPAAAMARVAVAGDGRFAYVGHVGLGQVVVLDLEEGRRLDLSGADHPEGDPDPIDARHDVRGFAVSGTILDLVTVPGEDWEDVFLSTSDGRVTAIRAMEGDDAVHTLSIEEQDPSTDFSQAFKPNLRDAGEEIELGFTPDPEYPNLGPLAVISLDEEGDEKQYYGVRFSERTDLHRTEAWFITWEGAIPGAKGLDARLLASDRLGLPGAGLCGLGVQPGDLAVIRFDEPLACADFQGREFEYTIADAGPDWLLLDSEVRGRQIADLPETAEERDDDEWVPEWDEAALDMPGPECFQGVLRVDLRADEQFVIRGSRTGFLHPVVESVEGCVLDAGADPLFTGRAVPSTVTSTDALTECPITEIVDGVEADTFANPIFEVDIFPPCALSEEGDISILEIERDLRWSFTVASGFDLRDLLPGGLPADMRFLPGPDQVYLLDAATRSIRAVEPFDEDGLYVDEVFL